MSHLGDPGGNSDNKGKFKRRAAQLIIIILMASLAMSFFIPPGETERDAEGNWMEVDASAQVGALSGCSLTYLPWSQRLLLFGGSDGASYSDTLWSFDPRGDDWDRLSNTYGPSPRAYHCVTIDERSRSMLVFGGYDGTLIGDLWQFKDTNDTWERLGDRYLGPAPSPRYGHAIAFDQEDNRLVLFGGFNGTFLNDMWEFDLDSSRWSTIGAEGGPSERSGHAMAIDQEGRMLYIQGGRAESGNITDLWKLDLDHMEWYPLEIAKVSGARFNHTMVIDPAGSRLYMFGGQGRRTYSEVVLQDLWRFDLNHESWGKVDSPQPPPKRYGHAMAFHVQDRYLYIYGGSDGSGIKDDMWKLHVGSPRPTELESRFTSAYAFFMFIILVMVLLVVATIFLSKRIERKREELKDKGEAKDKKPEFDFRLYQEDGIVKEEEKMERVRSKGGHIKKLETVKRWEGMETVEGGGDVFPPEGTSKDTTEVKRLKTLVCPSCGGKEMFYEGGMIFGNMYHCKDCDYIGAFVLEKDIQVTSDQGGMRPKKRYSIKKV